MLSRITPLILTYNEEANIGRTVDKLDWAKTVIVVDSGSTDATLSILSGFPNVQVFQRPFDNHASQWNWGLRECGIVTDWVLALDADYVLSEALISEIGSLVPRDSTSAYQASFRYCIAGKPLRGSLYPPVSVLYRREHASYIQDGHTQRLRVTGAVARLVGLIDHDDRKPLERWFAAQMRYARLEVDLLWSRPMPALSWPDRLRRWHVLMPMLVVPYCMLVKRCALDGWIGFFYTLQRTLAETILSLMLLERRIASRSSRSPEVERDDRAPERNAP